MNEFIKQQTTDEFLKEMFSKLREHSFSQVSLLDGADVKAASPLTGETVTVSQHFRELSEALRKLLVWTSQGFRRLITNMLTFLDFGDLRYDKFAWMYQPTGMNWFWKV